MPLVSAFSVYPFIRQFETIIGPSLQKFGSDFILYPAKLWQSKTYIFANSVDPDYMACYQQAHQALQCHFIFEWHPQLQQWICPNLKIQRVYFRTLWLKRVWLRNQQKTHWNTVLIFLSIKWIFSHECTVFSEWLKNCKCDIKKHQTFDWCIINHSLRWEAFHTLNQVYSPVLLRWAYYNSWASCFTFFYNTVRNRKVILKYI